MQLPCEFMISLLQFKIIAITNIICKAHTFILFQETGKDQELLSILKHVRPGNGFEPKFPIFSKVEINGKNTDPLWQFLRESIPTPSDNSHHLVGNPRFIVWQPVQRNDISWNFEKFLVSPEGIPYKRYSPKFETVNIKPDIEELIRKFI